MMTSLEHLISVISMLVPRPGPESRLAEDVQGSLVKAGILAEVECRLVDGRVDMRVETIAIELKIQGSPEKVLKQLTKYSKDPNVTDIVLVTSSAKLRDMPALVASKPLHVVYLPRL